MSKRIKTTDMAELLLEITEGKSPAHTKEAIKKYAALLLEKGIHDPSAIMRRFEKLYDEKKNILHATVSTAFPLTTHVESELKSELKKKYDVKEVHIESMIDEKNIGGMKLRIGDDIYDQTLAGSLKQLQTKLAQS